MIKGCKEFAVTGEAIAYLLDRLTILQGFLLSEAVSVHIVEHRKVCIDCVRRLADELGIDEEALNDTDIELAFLNSKARC